MLVAGGVWLGGGGKGDDISLEGYTTFLNDLSVEKAYDF